MIAVGNEWSCCLMVNTKTLHTLYSSYSQVYNSFFHIESKKIKINSDPRKE